MNDKPVMVMILAVATQDNSNCLDEMEVSISKLHTFSCLNMGLPTRCPR